MLTLTTAVPPVVEVAVTVTVIVSPAEMLIPLKLYLLRENRHQKNVRSDRPSGNTYA